MRMALGVLVATIMILPVAASGPPPEAREVLERAYDDHGRLVFERGTTAEDGVEYARFYRYEAKPENPGNGNGGGNGGSGEDDGGPNTDCGSNKYTLGGWHWTAPYDAYSTTPYLELSLAFEAWDAATGADLFGAVAPGQPGGLAGTRDGYNQIEFVDLGATSTIAVTTTWYNRFTGEALESDMEYNNNYDWSLVGEAGKMDVLNIATHEAGHTFGLTHPNGPAHKIGCLTMYAYADFGETDKRTLGDGDILGIQELYGA